jgi:hypothetical protein
MGRLMAHIARQPDPVCVEVEIEVEGGVSRWLAGVVVMGGGWGVGGVGGVELHQRRHSHSRLGVLLQFEYLRKTRGAKALRTSSRRLGRGGWATSTVSGKAARRRKAVALPRLTGLVKCTCKKKAMHSP